MPHTVFDYFDSRDVAHGAYMGVLRGAMDVDHLDPCGVYVGTTAGTVFASNDAGDSWTQLPCTLPRVLSLSVFTDG